MVRVSKQIGFTLVEVLVVLVITALTASILATGLETTWRNFSKLDSSFLTSNAAQLPKKWFIESVESTLLRQHTASLFTGDKNTFQHLTSKLPTSDELGVQQCRWSLRNQNIGTILSVQCGTMPTINIATLPDNSSFEYLIGNRWTSNFQNLPGQIPLAVRISNDNNTWALAVPTHPAKAELPAEIPITGRYEF